MIEFGNRLKTLRKQKKLTQKQLATQINVKNSIISFYENGDRFPSPEIIIKLSAVFHVSSDYLLGIENGTYIDVSGLTDSDIQLVLSLADTLRAKNNSMRGGAS